MKNNDQKLYKKNKQVIQKDKKSDENTVTSNYTRNKNVFKKQIIKMNKQ